MLCKVNCCKMLANLCKYMLPYAATYILIILANYLCGYIASVYINKVAIAF